jgi:hypothetical protein
MLAVAAVALSLTVVPQVARAAAGVVVQILLAMQVPQVQ